LHDFGLFLNKNMKTQTKQDIKRRTQNSNDQNGKAKKGNAKRNTDGQSVMAEMKIRSGRPNKKK
jgi:hypothetical protein